MVPQTQGRIQSMTMPDIFSDDPYAGYASCPDTHQSYIADSRNSQVLWIEKSQQTIQDYIDHLATFTDFKSAYAFLAQKRHHIALELRQRNEEGRTDYFGAFRQEGDHFRHTVYSGDREQFWKWQKTKIFELAYKLIEPAKNSMIQDRKTGYVYEDEHLGCLKELVSIDDNQATYYCVMIKFPHDKAFISSIEQLHLLSTVELFDFQENKKLNMIRIEYTPVNSITSDHHYQLLNHLYNLLLGWNQRARIDDFLTIAGKMAFMLSHFLPVKRGNASITEWMLRAIAFNKGIKLGYFNHAEGISWDFKAILTPDLQEYIKWFRSSAFLDYALIPDEEIAQGFKFDKY